MDIYVVRDGVVVPFLMTSHFEQQLPVIPSNINLVDLTWESGKNTVGEINIVIYILYELIIKICLWTTSS